LREGGAVLRAVLLAGVFAGVVFPAVSRAQSAPQTGGNEVQIWTGGGHGLNGSTSDTGVWNLGMRYGWILTDPAGPGFLRGRFEYALEAIPAFVVTQSTNTAYGIGLTPVGLKWNFVQRGHVVPYFDLDGGLLFSNKEIPPGTSKVNFTTSGALGLHFLRRRYNWNAEVRFMHISNAGLATPNPGINTIQFRIGFGRFSQR
jgi:lipid A 3-O-deacylase